MSHSRTTCMTNSETVGLVSETKIRIQSGEIEENESLESNNESSDNKCTTFCKYLLFLLITILFWICTFFIHQSVKKYKES